MNNFSDKWNTNCFGCIYAHDIYEMPSGSNWTPTARCSAQNNIEVPAYHPTVDCKLYKGIKLERV